MNEPQDGADARELYAAVGLGLDMAAFVKSDVGRYLLTKAEEERTDALADLVDTSPADPEQIRALQSIIKRADSLLYWIQDAIQSGKNAEMQLDPRENA